MLMLKKWTGVVVLALTFSFCACSTVKKWQGKKEKNSEESPELKDFPKLASQTHLEGKVHPIDVHKLDMFVAEAVKKTGIPGLSIAVVQDGKVVFAKGYGTTELGGNTPVDADTLFAIGSTTKPMTSLLVASLVDHGKLHWDDKAHHLYPKLKFADEGLSEKLTLEKMFCMCTGLPRRDFVMLNYKNKTAENTLKEVSGYKSTAPFGEGFQYSNQVYAAGGFIAALVAEPHHDPLHAYTQLMTSHIFHPLEMNRTVMGSDLAVRKGNYAFPHVWSLMDGKLRSSNFHYEQEVMPQAPAGAVWSSANDMAKYLALEINQGVSLHGKRLYSEENFLRRRNIQVKINESYNYGLGWFLTSKDGHEFVSHGGSTVGFNSAFDFFPQDKLGIVILSNTNESNTAFRLILNKLLELAFNSEAKADDELGKVEKEREDKLALLHK